MEDIKPKKLKKRTEKLCIALSLDEKRVLKETASMMDMSQTELIVYAVKKIRQIELQKREFARHERAGAEVLGS